MNRLLCLISCALFQLAVSAADWPRWRGPNHNGISAETGWVSSWPAEGPKKLWENKVGVGYSSVAVSKGRVYTMGNTDDVDTIWCYDAQTGAVVWKHEYPCSANDPNGFKGTRCTPTVDDDRVYTLSRHGHFFCLDANGGKVRWAKNLVDDFAGKEPRHGSNLENEGWGYSGSSKPAGPMAPLWLP
jgi:outer membrane protein assembly factor BamB